MHSPFINEHGAFNSRKQASEKYYKLEKVQMIGN